jgi:hypothetical protein
MHLLEYQATFRVPGYDYADWDELQHVLSEADRELGAAMPVTEIIQYIDEIEDLLRALQYTANSGDQTDITDGDQFTNQVVDGVGDVPQEIIDAGYASGPTDWAGFDDYKCMISYIVVDDLAAKLRRFAPFVDSAGLIIGGIATIASIITTIFTSGLSAIALGIIGATGITALFYQLVTDGSVLNGIADDVEDNREELACAAYLGDGSQDAHNRLNDEIDSLFNPITAAIIKTLNLGPTLKTLYGGRHDSQNVAQYLADLDYDPATFDCSCLGPPEPQDGCMTGLLRNCGFENPLGSEWVLVSGPAGLIRKTGSFAHDGTYGMGHTTPEVTIWYKQEFYADADYSEIDVQFWFRASSGLRVYVDGGVVFQQDFLQADSIWRFADKNIVTPISDGDLIEIRLRLHSTYANDSVNVFLTP